MCIYISQKNPVWASIISSSSHCFLIGMLVSTISEDNSTYERYLVSPTLTAHYFEDWAASHRGFGLEGWGAALIL